MPKPIRPSKIGDHEQQAHHNCGDGQEFTENHDVMHLAVVIQIRGDDHHDTTRR